MPNRSKVLVIVCTVVALAAWGASKVRDARSRVLALAESRALLDLDLRDHGAESGDEPAVVLRFLGPRKDFLAEARTVEPRHYVQAIDPDPRMGNCRDLEYGHSQVEYAGCMEK